MRRHALTALTSVILMTGCPEATAPRQEIELPGPGDSWAAGPYVRGHVTTTFEDTARGRTLTVEIWYPSTADAADVGAPTSHFEPEGERAGLEALLEAAPAGCPTLETGAARDARAWAALGPRPLVVFSHCMNCGRYSAFSLAERLASHGFVVVAPDHAGPRPFLDESAGEQLSPAQLATRRADMDVVLGAALDGALFGGVAALEGLSVDADAVGAMGHSFGSATTGFVAQDERVGAAVGIAAPMANPLFRGSSMAAIDKPVMLFVTEEDNSIGEAGNDLVRDNFADANSPAWRVDLADAGHWSISDIAGLTDSFMPGCGDDVRHSEGREGEDFTYTPAARGIEVTSRHVATFFLATLTDHAGAEALLEDLPAEDGVSVSTR